MVIALFHSAFNAPRILFLVSLQRDEEVIWIVEMLMQGIQDIKVGTEESLKNLGWKEGG